LILVARGNEAEEAEGLFDLYRRRWEIEILSAAFKSRGFDLETTHLTEADRIRKLLGVLALTYSWTRLIGIDQKKREGSPRICTNGYPEKSLFLLRTGSASRTGDELVSNAGRTQSLYSSTRVPELIFVM